jgi:transposase
LTSRGVRLCSGKNDFNDAEAIAEAVQRPTMKVVAVKTAEQLDLQALNRVRERLVSQRIGVINQIRAFLLERGIAVRQGYRFLRAELPTIFSSRNDAHSPGMARLIEDLASDWRRFDVRIERQTLWRIAESFLANATRALLAP